MSTGPRSESASVSPAKRSGSQKRQRSKLVALYLTPEEYAAVQVLAAEASLSASSLARKRLLGTEGPRARRSPPVNAEILARAIAQLNRAGNNLNQIAHALHAHQAVRLDVNQTLAEVRSAAAQIREAVGRRDRP